MATFPTSMNQFRERVMAFRALLKDRAFWALPERNREEARRTLLLSYIPSLHRIYVTDLYRGEILLVRHEMLHDLLNDVGHPREFFVERCGHLLGDVRIF